MTRAGWRWIECGTGRESRDVLGHEGGLEVMVSVKQLTFSVNVRILEIERSVDAAQSPVALQVVPSCADED